MLIRARPSCRQFRYRQQSTWSAALQKAEQALGARTSISSPSMSSSVLGFSTRTSLRMLSPLIQRAAATPHFTRTFFYTPQIMSATSQPTSESTRELTAVLGVNNMTFLTANISKLIETRHPMLRTVASYYFGAEGKKVRPLVVLLMAHATRGATRGHYTLAMITEMIHTASLLHDDVIDGADKRRGVASAPSEFGNKMAILAGDFLLGRAAVALAGLQNTQVFAAVAQVIGDLVQGEVIQFKGDNDAAMDVCEGGDGDWAPMKVNEMGMYVGEPLLQKEVAQALSLVNINIDQHQDSDKGSTSAPQWLHGQFSSYLLKTFMKTASLVARNSQAAVLLHGDASVEEQQIAFEFGKHLGMAFQLTDDLLDFTVTSEEFGKPSGGNDLRLGLATAPVLYAAARHPQLRPLIARDPNAGLTVADAVQLVCHKSDGLDQTRRLAQWYAAEAERYLMRLPDSPARDALQSLTQSLLNRRH